VHILEELKNGIVMQWRDKLTALKLRRDVRTEAPGDQKNAATVLNLDAVVPVDNFEDENLLNNLNSRRFKHEDI
jgi:hypothetical protein